MPLPPSKITHYFLSLLAQPKPPVAKHYLNSTLPANQETTTALAMMPVTLIMPSVPTTPTKKQGRKNPSLSTKTTYTPKNKPLPKPPPTKSPKKTKKQASSSKTKPPPKPSKPHAKSTPKGSKSKPYATYLPAKQERHQVRVPPLKNSCAVWQNLTSH